MLWIDWSKEMHCVQIVPLQTKRLRIFPEPFGQVENPHFMIISYLYIDF